VAEDNMALLMLTSSSKSDNGLVVTLTYDKTSITSSEVQTTLLPYDEREKKTLKKGASDGASDGLGYIVRNNHDRKYGKSKRKGNKESHCFHSYECGHIRKHRPTCKKTDGAAKIVVYSTTNSNGKLMTLTNELFDRVMWVLDSWTLYHVTSNKKWCFTYMHEDLEQSINVVVGLSALWALEILRSRLKMMINLCSMMLYLCKGFKGIHIHLGTLW
jgi:hypothetical protein